MALITLSQVLDAAEAGNYAVGAFNVSDLAQAEAVLEAARVTDSPVIIQAIDTVSAYADHRRWWGPLRALIDAFPRVPAVLHLDHGPTVESCRAAIDAGFTSVMIDGSVAADRSTPNSFEANVAVTAHVVRIAHAAGVSVEGELGTIGGSEGADGGRKEIVLADPDEAEAFVEQTDVDALAVAIGTSHGTFKFDRRPDNEILRLDLIEEIHRRVPDVHIVMHGSSSLPHDLVEEINALGGDLPESWGVPMEEKIASIGVGVRKINQGVDSQLAFVAGTRRALIEHPDQVDPGSWIASGRANMQRQLESRMRLFRSSGRAADHRL